MTANVFEELEKNEKIAFSEADLEKMGLGAAKTFKGLRHQGKGLPFIRIGRRIRYMKADVLNCLESGRFDPSQE